MGRNGLNDCDATAREKYLSMRGFPLVLPFRGCTPSFAPDVHLAPTAVVIGDVKIGSGSSIWFGTVVRGDVHYIRIGQRTNIQDGCYLHGTGDLYPLHIGNDVSIGHRAVVHGCRVGDRVLVGMGAAVLDGVEIGEESIVGAGAVVPEGTSFPSRSVLLGVPARRVRDVTDAELARILKTRDDYLDLVRQYRKEPA